MDSEILKYLFIGITVPLWWASVFWLTRRFAPYLMTPVGVAFRQLLRRRVISKQSRSRTSAHQ